jgi:hypothetical protein
MCFKLLYASPCFPTHHKQQLGTEASLLLYCLKSVSTLALWMSIYIFFTLQACVTLQGLGWACGSQSEFGVSSSLPLEPDLALCAWRYPPPAPHFDEVI